MFFDLVKIRRLVEEATTLTVRASNGTTSSALSNSLNASNGTLYGGSAAALGIGVGGSGVNAKLSRERRHRMREHASQKLSHAFHLDEIAASVATMQSASALEEVAKFVLQRNGDDSDAKYVHFFHEKIPSRALAACTSLRPLDEIIAQQPTTGAPYRTRAMTRILQEDFLGAAKDLTDGLAVCQLYDSQHAKDKLQIATTADLTRQNPSVRADGKLDDEDQPSSLEAQLLFHRAGAYLTTACDYIDTSLNGLKQAAAEPTIDGRQSPSQLEGREARRLVRTYAKRALRDYLNFLSHLDYTPGLPREITEDFFRKFNALANGDIKSKSKSNERRLLGYKAKSSNSSALIHQNGNDASQHSNSLSAIHPLPPVQVHPVNALFSAVPPPNLPTYPLNTRSSIPAIENRRHQPPSSLCMPTIDVELHESLTYHPLLTDALHSLLLCHILIQTSRAELLRHAHMVARLVRICDGYPIFLASRSPARADWIEVLRRVGARDWIGLETGWEEICRPPPLPGQQTEGKNQGNGGMTANERRKHEAVMEALADDRVDDEESFRAAVRARELRAAREEEEEQRREYLRSATHSPSSGGKGGGIYGAGSGAGSGNGGNHDQSTSGLGSGSGPKRWAQQGDGKEYPISTERAEALARWVREAPPPGGEGTKAKGRKRKPGKKGRKMMGGEGVDNGVEIVDAERVLEGLSVD